jgi:hypothetical protein
VPLTLVQATHVRVVCDACRTTSAEVCAKRELPVLARASAVPKFKKAGWHHDASAQGRVREWEHAEREGSGRWYCPACARRTHL